MATVLHSSENSGRASVCAVAIVALAALFAPSAMAQASGPPCDRACLTGFVDSYFKALLAHDARSAARQHPDRNVRRANRKEVTKWAKHHTKQN